MESPKFFTFTLTEVDSTMSYVSCLLFDEEAEMPDAQGNRTPAFVPKVLALVSHWPFFNTFRYPLFLIIS